MLRVSPVDPTFGISMFTAAPIDLYPGLQSPCPNEAVVHPQSWNML